MDVLQTEKDLMKQSMNEKDERIEGFEENMKLRETELIEVYRNDSNPVSDRFFYGERFYLSYR